MKAVAFTSDALQSTLVAFPFGPMRIFELVSEDGAGATGVESSEHHP